MIMRNLVIAIVCTIYVLIMTPIERAINRRIARRWLAYLANFGIGMIILVLLFLIAGAIGYRIWD